MFCRGACAKRLAFDTNAATTTALSSLRATLETDNCGGALWLASSARASSALRLASYSFAHPAKNIRSASCRTSSGNSPIQRKKSGRARPKKILTNLQPPPVRPKLFPTKLVRQRSSHGQLQIPHIPSEDQRDAAGGAVHHRQRSSRAICVLRDELNPDDLHDQVSGGQNGSLERHATRESRSVVSHICYHALFPADCRSSPRRRRVREILGHLLAVDRLRRWTLHARVNGLAGGTHR